MLVSRRNTRFSALIGPAFVGIALITGFTLISLKAVQAADRTEDIASRPKDPVASR
jgi:Ni/Fe-hydrogenase subunit HybB-like protein